MIELDQDRNPPAIIKVVGVGGGGSNAVDRMITNQLQFVEFIAINTDEQALSHSKAQNKLVIGKKITMGLGAGGDPEIGQRAAKEDREKIAKLLDNANMVFITAGMGGGTGTGAAPIVAEIAKSLGALTVAVVTLPFVFEGKVREKNAKMGIEALRQVVDTLIVIKNDQIFQIIEPNTPAKKALKIIDEILYNAVRGISDIINKAGIINVDFADVKNIMKSSGEAVLGFGRGVGENKVRDAVNQAMNNVLLENPDISGATGVLLNVIGGRDLSLQDWKDVSEYITKNVDPEANKIIGLTIDENLENEVQVIVIATGFKKRTKAGKPQEVIINQQEKIFTKKDEIQPQERKLTTQKEPYPYRRSLENQQTINVKNWESQFQKEEETLYTLNFVNEQPSSKNFKKELIPKEEVIEAYIPEKTKKKLYFNTDDDFIEWDFEELKEPAYLRRKKVDGSHKWM
ncbi:MAG: cell division protein FtsZ [Leptospiraceae bacterium]|nr:cell division protein FtsZ [Leptospiraceae bacterium]MDW7976442.1 cell division protein FtsZ [Leptospiraceae bacterium]